MRTLRVAVILAAVAIVVSGTTGCTKKQPSTTPQGATPAVEAAQTPSPATTPGATTQAPAEPFPPQPVDKSQVTEPSIDEMNRQGVLQTVHFAYNSNELDDAARAILQANAAWMKAHARHTVEIGGHCDERGSIGYNVALGDRRAGSVRDYLVGLGADGSKLTTVSYGEEKPVDPGHDETAWAKNRRAEFLIKQ
jgi:peptidoglycan-associated lipoprotein